MPRDDAPTDQSNAPTPSWGELDGRAHLHVLEMMVQRLYMQLANRTNDPGRFIEQTLTITLSDIAHFRTPPDMSQAEGDELRRLMARHADALFHGIRPGR